MPRVITDLVDVRSYLLRQAIVLLQIDRQVGRRAPANPGQRFGIFRAVDRDPHHVRPGSSQIIDLSDRGLDVLGVCGRHALDRNRMAGANRNRTNANRASWVAA